jgi:hypothetical protein
MEANQSMTMCNAPVNQPLMIAQTPMIPMIATPHERIA